MSLKEKIQEDLKTALKEKNEIETSTLRLVLAAISNKETEKRTKIWKEKPELSPKELEKESQLTDEEIVEVIGSEIKKRKEAILLFEKGERTDLVEKEKKELEILKKYLPEQMSEDRIKEEAKKVIEEIGASGPKDTGKVMSALMPKLKGKAEGGVVSKIVGELLKEK
jgi:hypothetical protein